MGFFGSRAAIGVDTGSNTIKVIQLKRAGSRYELDKFATAPVYPSGDRPEDPQAQRDAKIEALKRALVESKIKSKNAISAVSGDSVIVRYLQLPQMPENELKKALQWEAEEYIPFRLDEVNIDSMVLGPSADDENRADVLLVSAKKDLVADHLSIIKGAGLNPTLVDVDSFAFLNCYEQNYDIQADECVALVNMGAQITGISMFQNGIPRFSRDIPIGGDTITSAISSHMRCPYAEAETLKINQGASPPSESQVDTAQTFSGSLMDTIRGTVDEMTGGEGSEEDSSQVVARAIDGVLVDLISEVQRSIEFFENQMRGVSVSRIILGGGTAMLINLKERFEQVHSLPTEVIDPLRKIQAPGSESARLDPIKHSLGVGIGLAIRGLAA